MSQDSVVAPINVRQPMPKWRTGTGFEYLYRYSMTKSGKFRVNAIYTGLPTGCIGAMGKSFATAEQRDVATRESCERFLRGQRAGSSWTACEGL